MVAPRVKLSEKYIVSELEEMEREDNFRLKRFKELKTKKNKCVSPVCPVCKVPIDITNICTCEKPIERQRIICPVCDEDSDDKDKECICEYKEEDVTQPASKASSKFDENVCTFDKAVGDVLREVCSCPQIADVKQPVKVIKEATVTPEKSCTCIDGPVDWDNLCKIIGTDKLKELKDIYTAKSKQSQNECPCETDSKSITKTPEKSCSCIPKPVNLDGVCKNCGLEEMERIKEVYLQKSINPDQSRYECCCEPVKDKSNIRKGNCDAKSVQVPSKTSECLKCQKVKSKESKTVSINDGKDGKNVEQGKGGVSQDLGITVTEFKEVVTIKRFRKEDGTIGEERQVVTMKSEAKHPLTPTQSGKSLKQRNSTESAQTKMKISLPDKKSASNASAKSTCKVKASGSNSSTESRVSFKEVEYSTKEAQTEKSKSCCKINKENKSTSVTSSLDGKSSDSCLKHSSSTKDSSKNCCLIKIVSKPKDTKGKDDKVIADNCFELIKRLLLEANKSNASKSSVCSCQSKMKSSTSQTCDCTKSRSLKSEKSSQCSSGSFVSFSGSYKNEAPKSCCVKKSSDTSVQSTCKCKSEAKKCPTCGSNVTPPPRPKASECSCGKFKPAKSPSNQSVLSYDSFQKSIGTETDCPKCAKAQRSQQKPDKCPSCAKNASFKSKSESYVQPKCCQQPKIEAKQSKCSVCSQQNACSCHSKPTCLCSQESRKSSKRSFEHSKSSVQFVEREICCEPKSKEAATTTRRSDRYDVRNIEMLKFEPKKPSCTCSDPYLGDKWFQPPPKANSYHGRKSNVLSKIIVPRIHLTAKYIDSELDENEREESFRLKRVKQKKIEKRNQETHQMLIDEMDAAEDE